MTKKELQDALAGLFVPCEGDLEGVCFNLDYIKAYQDGKKTQEAAVYEVVSDALHDAGLSDGMAYKVTSRAVDILQELEDWEDEDGLHEAIDEAIDGAVPVYNSELMAIYSQDWWAVEEAKEELGSTRDAVQAAAQAWYMLIGRITREIYFGLMDIATPECGDCGREATIKVGDNIHRCDRCAEL